MGGGKQNCLQLENVEALDFFNAGGLCVSLLCLLITHSDSLNCNVPSYTQELELGACEFESNFKDCERMRVGLR